MKTNTSKNPDLPHVIAASPSLRNLSLFIPPIIHHPHNGSWCTLSQNASNQCETVLMSKKTWGIHDGESSYGRECLDLGL